MENIVDINYKEIKMDDLIIKTTEEEKDEYPFFIDYKHGLDKRELKLIIFTKYVNDKLVLRDNIKLIVDKYNKYNKGDIVEIKTGSRTPIGCGTIAEIKSGEVVLNSLKLYDEKGKKIEEANEKEQIIKAFFIPHEKCTIIDYKDYIKGLFKIYYKSLEYFVKNMDKYPEKIKNKKGEEHNEQYNKFNGMCSYLAIRDVLKEYYDISESNVFIQNKRIEYDMLLLKQGVDINKGIYDKKDVVSTVEIKTSGYFGKDFKEYIKGEKDDELPHIYFSIHESERKVSKNYSSFINDIEALNKESNNNNKVIPIFCALKNDSEKFIVPIDFDLETIMKKI